MLVDTLSLRRALQVREYVSLGCLRRASSCSQDQKEAAGMDVDSRQPEAAEAEADADAAGVQHHKTKGGRKVKMVTRCKRAAPHSAAVLHFQHA